MDGQPGHRFTPQTGAKLQHDGKDTARTASNRGEGWENITTTARGGRAALAKRGRHRVKRPISHHLQSLGIKVSLAPMSILLNVPLEELFRGLRFVFD